jgi:hypothetical protein
MKEYMNINMSTSLRLALLILTSALFFSPVSASALTSNGADGLFQPTASMYLDTTQQQTFNFTDIYIPSGVTINISGPSSALPFILLATGNVDIVGGIVIGSGNSLWIETPGSISLSGSLTGYLDSSISLVSSVFNMNGIVNVPGGNFTLNSGGGITPVGDITLNSGAIITPSGNITLNSGAVSTSGGYITLSSGAVSRPSGYITLSSGGSSLSGGYLITNPTDLGIVNLGLTDLGSVSPSVGVLILSPVPEPEVWAMLFLGLFALFFVSRIRNQNEPV